eukprot:4889324-Pyramimonas_sp.AAC.1
MHSNSEAVQICTRLQVHEKRTNKIMREAMQTMDMEAKLEAVRDHTVTTGLYSNYRLNTTERNTKLRELK